MCAACQAASTQQVGRQSGPAIRRRHVPRGVTALRAVHTRSGQAQRGKQRVEIGDTATCDECNSSVELRVQGGEQTDRALRHANRGRDLRNLEKRSVDIQEQGPVVPAPLR